MSERRPTQFPFIPPPGNTADADMLWQVKEMLEMMAGFRRGVIGLARVIYSDTEPLEGGGNVLRQGDLWVDRSRTNKLLVWSGAQWEEVTV